VVTIAVVACAFDMLHASAILPTRALEWDLSLGRQKRSLRRPPPFLVLAFADVAMPKEKRLLASSRLSDGG
jgi:hypothetical protein